MRGETCGLFRIILVGFSNSDFGSAHATFNHLFDSDCFERVSNISEIHMDGPSIYSVVVNARSVGFSVEEIMKPLYEKMRGTHIVVYADGFLPMGIIKRFYWANADIVYSNIETDIEYHNMSEAIRKRYGYKSEAVRMSIAERDTREDLRYTSLTSKEREYLNLTILGISVKEIAFKMQVKEATVSAMRKKICQKLGVQQTGQLIHEGTLYAHNLKKIKTEAEPRTGYRPNEYRGSDTPITECESLSAEPRGPVRSSRV